MSLTTLAKAKAYLKIPTGTTTDDALLTDLVNAACDAITSAISRNILSAQYADAYNGTGTGTLMLANTPITAVDSLAIVAPLASPLAAQNTTPLLLNVDFTFTQYALRLYRGVFPRGVANVVVAYTAGFAIVPSDLAHAATKWAAMRYRELERLGHKSKTLQGETVDFDLSELPPDVSAIVNRYQVKIPRIAVPTGIV